MSLPEQDNVCGLLYAPVRLQVVYGAVKELLPEAQITLSVSGFTNQPILWVTTELLELESEPLDDGNHLLNGVACPSFGRSFLKQLSACFIGNGIAHRLEWYSSSGDLVRVFQSSESRASAI